MKHAQVLLASSSVEKGRGLSLEGSTGEPSPGPCTPRTRRLCLPGGTGKATRPCWAFSVSLISSHLFALLPRATPQQTKAWPMPPVAVAPNWEPAYFVCSGAEGGSKEQLL